MDDEAVTNDVHNAIADALMTHEKAMLGPWVLVAATTSEDGSRGVWALEATGNLRYETFGLLTDALDRATNGDPAFAYLMDEDDEDES